MGGRVFILDDDDDLRATLSDVIELMLASSVVSAGSVEQMIEQKDRVLACSMAILDINLGADRESGLDAYFWLRRHGFRGTIVFLTGHGRNHPLVDQALRLGQAAVHDKPITVENLRHLLDAAPAAGGP
jgi:DNA-binding NtrC family response regulator